jgi:aryl-alcohol dehydrogenase-like predicted oxidoreductase
MEEVVRAFNYVIEKGWVSAFLVNRVGFELKSFKAFYWGTSEWSAEEIEEAHRMYFTLSRSFR